MMLIITNSINSLILKILLQTSNKISLLLALLFCAIAAFAADLPAPNTSTATEQIAPEQNVLQQHFSELWQDAYPLLTDTLKLKDQHETLPKSAWFSHDQADNIEDINELLQEALDLFSFSDVNADIKYLRELRNEITELREDIGDYQSAKIGRPDKAEKYEAKIAALKAEISAKEAVIEDAKSKIHRQLLAMGLNVNREQVDVLLAGVSGTDIVEMTVVFNNVKLFSNQLAELMAVNNEDLGFAKKHYGLYVVLIELLIRMQQQFLDDVEQRYLTGIEAITERTKKLVADTENMLMFETAQHRRAALQQSLASQKLSLQTVTLYRRLLERQANQVRAAQNTLEKDLDVALIRYHTVKLSGELVSLMQASKRQFHVLTNLQIPDIAPFENQQMKAEFEKLTAELQGRE